MTARDAAAVTAFWRDLGLPGIVDVHTHFMPDRVMRKVWDYFDAVGPLIGREWPITYRDDDETRLTLLRGLVFARSPRWCIRTSRAWPRGSTSWAAEFAAATPDCLHTATFYPEPDAADYVRTAIGTARESSRRTCRSAITTPPTHCSTRCGASSPRRRSRP